MANEKSGTDGSRVASKSAKLATFNTLILVGLLAIRSVPWVDLFFAVFISFYVYFMSKTVYPHPGVKPAEGGWTFRGGKYFNEYVFGAAILGLFLPLGQIIFSYLTGDQLIVREAAPHLFLLAAQVLSENLTFQQWSVSLPIKAMIPVTYNAFRLISLHAWAAAVFSRDLRGSSVSFASTAWHIFWPSVAVGNVIFWHYNLWGFLLPSYLPWALRTHFKGQGLIDSNSASRRVETEELKN